MKDAHANAAATIPLASARRSSGVFGDYVALTKPRLNVLVVATSAAGYYLGASGAIDTTAMTLAVCGTALVAGGAAVLNQLYERDTDALMRRTRLRPLPAGRVTPGDARTFGMSLSIAGLVLLAARANWLAGALALGTTAIYLAVYTPMKRRTPIATLVGAIPGALPALIGWTASHGRIAGGGAVLFAIVFLWQIPHFMAIAWLYREDFERAGFPLLPVVHPDGRSTARQAILFSVLLIPVSLAPFFLHMTGIVYAAGAVSGGLALLAASLAFMADRTNVRARRLFLGSITYLPLLWVLLIADRV